RYKNRHHQCCGELHCLDGRTKRKAVNRRGARCSFNRRPLCRFAKSLPLGLEGPVEDGRRRIQRRETRFEGQLMFDSSTKLTAFVVATLSLVVLAMPNARVSAEDE